MGVQGGVLHFHLPRLPVQGGPDRVRPPADHDPPAFLQGIFLPSSSPWPHDTGEEPAWPLPQLSVPGGSDGKASAHNAGDLGSIRGSGRSPGEGNSNPLQYSVPEKIPWTEEPGRL